MSWWSKKENLIVRSSVELQLKLHTLQIQCDNLSTVSLAHSPTLHSRIKHMELDIFFVKEKVILYS